MIKNIIFDLNGVVIHTDKTILKNPILVQEQNPFTIIQPTLDFIRSQHGKRKLYILSNFSQADEFDWLPHYYPELLPLFDGITVSAHVGYKKPNPAIFLHLIAEFQIDPKESLFIDDEITNVEVARQLGMHGIFFHPTIDLTQELQKLS